MAVCKTCGAENRPGARFCDSCGAPLAAATPSREVRKTVTVFFSDVTGSTALGERVDPETLRRVMSRYFEAARAALERHGGTVEKFIGDAVMAVFGIPQAHEDDALRALRAAVELRESMHVLNAELERDHGVSLEARIGVSTGEVVAGTEERLATGDAVNVAARLEQAAAPGEILVGEQTLRLARDAVEVEPLEPLVAKGKSEPLRAFRLVRLLEDALPFRRRIESPLVGRQRELALLRQAYDRAVSERRCHLFTVLGAAGVGKSRLVLELTRGLGDAQVVTGRCLPYGEGITFWPLIEVFRDAGAAHELEAALGLSSTEDTAWAVRTALERLAAERPLVVVIDDLHWGESTFVELVEHVADLSRGAPILLICIARPELLDLRPAWGGGKVNATSVLLEPLSEDEAGELIENLAGRLLDERAVQRILRASEGNPLFVEEMLAIVDEDGDAELDVPPTIHALLAARLDRLSDGERQVLERAAVDGRVFHRSAVVELAEKPLRQEVTRHLVALVRKELVEPAKSGFDGEDAFRFRHELMRGAAYESLPKEARAELHARFAPWLERREGTEEIVGYHFEQAFRYRAELGPLTKDARALGREAAARLGEGGRRARSRGDGLAAAKLLRRAVAALDPDSPERFDLVPDLLGSLAESGAFDEARAMLAEGLEAASARGDARTAARLRVERALVAGHSEPETDMDGLFGDVEEAIREFEPLGEDRVLAMAWTAHGILAYWRGSATEGTRSLARARDYARRAGDRATELRTMWWTAWTTFTGPTRAEEGVAICAVLGDESRDSRFAQSTASYLQADFLAMLGSFDEARALHRKAAAQAADIGVGVQLAGVYMTGGLIELLADDAGRAEALLRVGCEHCERLGETGYLSTMAALLAEALYRLDRDEEALEQTRVSERTAAVDDVMSQLYWRSTRAKILSRAGDVEQAEQLAREAIPFGERTDYIDIHADALRALAEVLAAAGKPEKARVAAQQALELHERKGNAASAARAHALLDAIADPVER